VDRRHFLALTAAVPALAVLLQACGGDDGSTTSTTSVRGGQDGPMQLRSNVDRVSIDPSRASVAAEAINAFGADLHRRLAEADPGANLVFSPASILLALAMTRAGAVGATATEVDQVLHVANAAGFFDSCNALDAALGEVSGRVETASGSDEELTLEIANSLWPQSGFEFEQAFLDLLASQFGTGVYVVDYRADPDVARVAINGWVDEHTAGRIPQLLAPGTITPESRLTLVNAVYLKAPWQRAFEENATSTAPFTTADGATVDVEMMHATRHLGFATGEGWQAVEVPYAGDRLAMLLVLPDVDVAALEAGSFAWPATTELAGQKVRLGLPRWDIETSASLGDVLAALGMPTAFTDDADFTGMTTQEPLYIGAVIHQANITVDEAGTEAAAATAVVMEAGAAPSPDEPPVVTFDRPFLFAVRDKQTGAILFQGRITNPTG
jgi:serine protease inhibitor